MANTTRPAGSIGGGTDASVIIAAGGSDLASALPERLRVHALAKLLSVSSKDVMAALTEIGATVRSAQSSIDRETALRALDALLPDPAADPTGIDELAPDTPARPPVGSPSVLQPAFNAATPVFLPPASPPAVTGEPDGDTDQDESPAEGGAAVEADGGTRRRRRRGRRGRGRGKTNGDAEDGSSEPPDSDDQGDRDESDESESPAEAAEARPAEGPGEGTARRRRRRRRRRDGSDDEPALGADDPPDTVVHVRESKGQPLVEDEVQAIRGSTRLEAKRQRRRDGREAGRRRVAILSESEFLARRESVERTMVVRERPERTQIAVLEDDILVEHFVTTSGSGSLVGNVYLGRVQNVLPSMEAAFVDIGRGRNAVLYAGEVDWDAAGLEGKARRIEQALSSGDSVLVQVTKDPIGHKGARLTSHVTLSGRHLVYVPGGHASGISRKLPDTERKRLRDILKKLVPEEAGVIVRTAAEGASADDLARDVARLTALWDTIQEQAASASAPAALYEEPDLVIRVVRDLFNEDFSELQVSGDDAATMVEEYVSHVSPDLVGRVRRHAGPADVFGELRIDEQLMKALDRKVYLPSGGSLVIDRTEAMTVIDVNTGKFIGSGGNLEETVTRNNLEAAEEIVRQLRLRDVGGIIVIDFIDMVLESNRELVLRRLTECLGRDRTKHQVTEITSLGLVQMTRKRLGQPLIDAFSETCEHCKGRGVIIHLEPTGTAAPSNGHKPEGKAEGRRRGRKAKADKSAEQAPDPAAESGAGAAEAESAAADEAAPRRRRSTRRRSLESADA